MARRILLAALVAWSCAASVTTRAAADSPAKRFFEEGNRRYAERQYPEALEAYRTVLAAEQVSAELFHNMGNAALQSGEAGWAIYYFEQARRRAPLDPDIAANLALARRTAAGGESEGSQAIVLEWIAQWMDLVSPARAGVAVLLLVWLGSGAILFDWWRPGSKRRSSWIRWGVAAGLCAAGLLVALEAAQQAMAPQAVVVKAGPAHSEPSEDSTVEFRLAVGSAVDLGRRQGGWREVRVSESLRGWLQEASIAEFARPR